MPRRKKAKEASRGLAAPEIAEGSPPSAIPELRRLRAFVVARINPLRFQRGAKAAFEPTMEKMLGSARKFKPESVKADQLARAAGPPEE